MLTKNHNVVLKALSWCLQWRIHRRGLWGLSPPAHLIFRPKKLRGQTEGHKKIFFFLDPPPPPHLISGFGWSGTPLSEGLDLLLVYNIYSWWWYTCMKKGVTLSITCPLNTVNTQKTINFSGVASMATDHRSELLCFSYSHFETNKQTDRWST